MLTLIFLPSSFTLRGRLTRPRQISGGSQRSAPSERLRRRNGRRKRKVRRSLLTLHSRRVSHHSIRPQPPTRRVSRPSANTHPSPQRKPPSSRPRPLLPSVNDNLIEYTTCSIKCQGVFFSRSSLCVCSLRLVCVPRFICTSLCIIACRYHASFACRCRCTSVTCPYASFVCRCVPPSTKAVDDRGYAARRRVAYADR